MKLNHNYKNGKKINLIILKFLISNAVLLLLRSCATNSFDLQTLREVSCWSRQCRLDAAVLRHTSRQYNTTPPPYWRRSCWPSKPSSSPLSWKLPWSPEAKLATQEAPASPPVEAQLTGAQLVQKREIIRELSRRSKARAGWRKKPHKGCWFKSFKFVFAGQCQVRLSTWLHLL